MVLFNKTDHNFYILEGMGQSGTPKVQPQIDNTGTRTNIREKCILSRKFY